MPLVEIAVALAAALLSAGLALGLLAYQRAGTSPVPEEDATSLLFEDGVLHHVSDKATRRFALESGVHEWEDLRDKVVALFPDFPTRADMPEAGEARLAVQDRPSSEIVISRRGGMVHVAFRDDGGAAPLGSGQVKELEILRGIGESIPHPVWYRDADGELRWHNTAYAKLARRARLGETSDEATELFPDLDMVPETGQRASLGIGGADAPEWFDITRKPLGDGAVFNASLLTAVVKAEEAQRNFVQTLAKTFAQLSIGLAIFDRNRQLALFNPALIDLTALPAEFLSARPTMVSFFDHLRETRRMPEPKNYRNWRQEISEVIAAADNGRYQETWTLESGHTYRVSGRPHPDGATAFLIEDISAEISLTRNFRAEMELAQCLLDTVEDGLAVFSASGRLTFSNTMYQELWGIDPEASFVDFTVSDSVALWEKNTGKETDWRRIEDFVMSYGNRESFSFAIEVGDRGMLACQVVPIVSGATLVRFCKRSVLTTPSAEVDSLKQ